MNQGPDIETYSLKAKQASETVAPQLDYRPPKPRAYKPRIALMGAGGISAAHLEAYQQMDLDVAVIASPTLTHAQARRAQFFPAAEASDDIQGTLERPDIDIVDLTPHPSERLPLINTSLNAGKHVLSQKPFVLDLDDGLRLVELAEAKNLKLAVNQNGRWAPHFSWMREAVRNGLIGEILSVHLSVHWDHGWIKGTAFETVDDVIFYDFAIHWFDFLTSLIGGRAKSVFASVERTSSQNLRPPMLAQAMVRFDGGQAALLFDASTRFGACDRTVITGSEGTLTSEGPDLGNQSVSLTTSNGIARPILQGTWFKEGFQGTMGALLDSIESGTTPLNNARDNLDALALAFTAIASSRRGMPVTPGAVRSLDEATGMD